ncbi:fructokinase, PfkB domain protein [Mycobacterium xenopi 4042]|uniref:Fructokinase, PfkB domain protein n=1 Tax=Mycobacterium xenopi 4042 TaxID=1299334 RepID=X8AF27_MYCXE|nr:fructokinase, PfkB domain protein [Mycobacterium xenopi 4042]
MAVTTGARGAFAVCAAAERRRRAAGRGGGHGGRRRRVHGRPYRLAVAIRAVGR